MIVVGSLWLLFPARQRLLTLYKAGLRLEIVWMDIPYTYAYTLVALRRSVPGFPGLAVLMMVLHHLTVLPDLVSAYFEFTEDLLEAAMDEAVEKFHQLAKRKVT